MYVALKRLKWGDGFIEIGEPVPEDEPGRNYNALLFSHSIAGEAGTDAVPAMSDEEMVTAYQQAVTDRDAALARVADLEGASPVDVPDGVTPGETPGWPIDAVTGGALALTDEQRSGLEAEGISGEAIVTHQGDIVQIEAEGEAPEVDATDAAVKLAAEHDIDLASVTGSGEEGRITQPDVQKAIDAATPSE